MKLPRRALRRLVGSLAYKFAHSGVRSDFRARDRTAAPTRARPRSRRDFILWKDGLESPSIADDMPVSCCRIAAASASMSMGVWPVPRAKASTAQAISRFALTDRFD